MARVLHGRNAYAGLNIARSSATPENVQELLAALAGSNDLGVVYYVRDGGLIKIGTTTNLPDRMRRLRLPRTCLMALEVGGTDVERARHATFADLRAELPEAPKAREWFHPGDTLLSHINDLRRVIGFEPVAW